MTFVTVAGHHVPDRPGWQDPDCVHRFAARDAVPWHLLRQDQWFALNRDRKYVCPAPGSHRSGAWFEYERLVVPGTGSFGKQQQALAILKICGTGLEQILRLTIRYVVGGPYGKTHHRILHYRLLDDAVRLWEQGNQDDDINQRRVVGNDELPAPVINIFTALDAVVHEPEEFHKTDKGAKTLADHSPRRIAASLTIANKNEHGRENEEPEDQSADTEHDKTKGRTGQSYQIFEIPAHSRIVAQ